LIKKLEDLGIGRPSTYASVMKTIDRRGYVWKKGKSLVPAFRAFAVVNLLQTYFADLVDYQFTAAMEDQLDEIAQGTQDLEPWLQKFYFGDPSAQTELAKLGLEHMTHEQHPTRSASRWPSNYSPHPATTVNWASMKPRDCRSS
jgi:DNA topoisomerase-1